MATQGQEPQAALPEPAAASFDECLRLVAWAHFQELRQARQQSALLQDQLERATPSQQGTPCSDSRCVVATADAPEDPEQQLVEGGQTLRLLGAADAGVASMSLLLPGVLDADGCAAATRASTKSPREGDARQSFYSSAASETDHRFPLMKQWRQEADPSRSRRDLSTSSRSVTSVSLGRRLSQILTPAETASLGSDASRSPAARPWYISYPSSRARLLWDMFGAALILYDLFSIPLQAFDPPRTTFVLLMDWFTLVFWTINMLMSLQVGFVVDGVTIMEPRRILVNYLRTWFAIDAVVVIPDWAVTLSYESSSSTSDGLKLLRTLRLVRLVRLLRLLRLAPILQSLNDLIETEWVSIFANIGKMLMVLVVINHYVGCIWYLIGTSKDGDDTWVVQHSFRGEDWAYQYSTSFHWAITQFTPASMSVQPQNFVERSFAVLVVVFGLVCFSYVVGSITGSITQLRSLSEETHKQFWMMRRYLKQNHVSIALSSRITRYLEHAWQSQRQTVNLQDYKIFSLLSEQLQSELHCEIWMPCLRAHELFAELSEVSSMTMRRIATAAMQRKPLAQGDNVFHLEKATNMYILVRGGLRYARAAAGPCDELVEIRHAGDSLAEPVLWTPSWVHLGVLTSTRETEVLALDPAKFGDIMRRSPDAFSTAIDYGRSYIEMLNEVEEHELSDILHFSRPAPPVQPLGSMLSLDHLKRAVAWRPAPPRSHHCFGLPLRPTH